MADSEFKITLTLKQESPMLHFQTNEPGFCIRGTELKPALDKFLLRLIKRDLDSVCNPGSQEADPKNTDEKKPKKYSLAPYLSGNGSHPALDYKIKLTAGVPAKMDCKIPLYYGDKKTNYRKQSNNVLMVTWNQPISMEILCFNSNVRKYLTAENLRDFFLCTNFGRMKSKGFGSFTVQTYCGKPVNEPASYPAVWKKHLDAAVCYTVKCYKPQMEAKLNKIKTVYTKMKTGDGRRKEPSYLSRYLKLNGEKDAITKFLLGEAEADAGTLKKYRYTRAVLGTSGQYSFPLNNCDIGIAQEAGDGEAIERYPSPLLFKILGGRIYIVPLVRDNTILNQSFSFTLKPKDDTRLPKMTASSDTTEKSILLETPKSFDLIDFLNYCSKVDTDIEKAVSRNG